MAPFPHPHDLLEVMKRTAQVSFFCPVGAANLADPVLFFLEGSSATSEDGKPGSNMYRN